MIRQPRLVVVHGLTQKLQAVAGGIPLAVEGLLLDKCKKYHVCGMITNGSRGVWILLLTHVEVSISREPQAQTPTLFLLILGILGTRAPNFVSGGLAVFRTSEVLQEFALLGCLEANATAVCKCVGEPDAFYHPEQRKNQPSC